MYVSHISVSWVWYTFFYNSILFLYSNKFITTISLHSDIKSKKIFYFRTQIYFDIKDRENITSCAIFGIT